jgi:thiol-disulfide isomerase/thioredoxin
MTLPGRLDATSGDAANSPAPDRRRWLLGGAGLLAATAGAGWSWWRTAPGDAQPGAADAMWALRFERPGGGELVMAELRGRPLLVNFWATWCPPCVREMPALDRLAQAHAAKLRVVGLAIDGRAPVEAFLKRQPVRFDIGLAAAAGTDLSRTLGNHAGGLPFTVLLDAKGAVVQRKIGETRYEELVRWLESL